MRVVLQRLLHHQRKAIKSLAHVGVAGRQPHPDARRNRDHRRDSALTTRASDDASTSAPTTIRSPPMSTIYHPARWARRCNWRSRTSRVCDRHRQELDRFLPTDCVGSSLLTPPGEQQIRVDATFDTDPPGAKLSATIRRFSPVDQKRR
jgi:hypothetical protein